MKMHDFYGENPTFLMNGETLDGYCHVIDEQLNEMVDNLNEDEYNEEHIFSKKDIKKLTDLSSFRPNKSLHPKIWPNKHINSKVRLRLLDIADDFIDLLNVRWAKPVDIILTGSLANFNWSKFSDFDLHILYDFSKVDKRVEFVREYFNSKKNEWNNTHENLKIYGFPVEVYVQDTNEEHTASGVYSLERNNWLKIPEANNIKAIKLNKYFIKEKTFAFVRKITDLEDKCDLAKNEFDGRKLGEQVKKLLDKLKGLRKESLKKCGEMGAGNIIYKLLRRNGYLNRLLDLKAKTYDREKSLNESKN